MDHLHSLTRSLLLLTLATSLLSCRGVDRRMDRRDDRRDRMDYRQDTRQDIRQDRRYDRYDRQERYGY